MGLRSRWTADDTPDQSGRVAVVTGASGGLGLETARALASRGATVVAASRDASKADVRLDLASLASVRTAADEILARFPRVDLLINNAGVMEAPYSLTEDGFELTLATNHLGHFALTGLLLERLLRTPGSRVVTVTSLAHRRGRIAFDDLNGAADAYAQSKLANLLFAFELDERLAGTGTISLAAHPGIVSTVAFAS